MKKSLCTAIAKFPIAKSFLCAAFIFLLSSAFAQAPIIEWQKCIGGTDWDFGRSIQQTTDGGYIIAGSTRSNNGDVTGNHGFNGDYWVVKLDGSGNLQWQKCFGGSSGDYANSIQQTTDGGYIVAGACYSNDGDITGYHGNGDYWVVKLDDSGNIQWQESLGGTSGDDANSIQQTADGGYIVAGQSFSNDGDVTGNHGDWDYWIVKLNGSGNLQWQKSLGGSNDDYANSIQQTADGGYIVAGVVWSTDGDVTGNHGLQDYWVVKLDNNGNTEWQKTLGGSYLDVAQSIQQTTDGGYIVAGNSGSTDGDVTGNHDFQDYWVVKLDSSGNIQWQKSLGGFEYDWAHSIQQTADGGYIVAGHSWSINGDVTDNHNGGDYWVVKLDGSGNIEWQKAIGGIGEDYPQSIRQTADGGYIVAGYSDSNDGDVTGNHGFYDYWIVKLAGMETGTESIVFPGNIAVYPNPATQELTIDLTGSEFSSAGTVVTLFDIQGRNVLEKTINNLVIVINVMRLEKGLYFLRVENKEMNVVTRLVID